LPGGLSVEQDLYDSFSDIRALQPPRTRRYRIKQTVGRHELRAMAGPLICDLTNWKRTSQTPCEEVRCAVPLPVRQFAMESRHANMVASTIGILRRRTRLTPRVQFGITDTRLTPRVRLKHHGWR
jgi:hypothetical protein